LPPYYDECQKSKFVTIRLRFFCSLIDLHSFMCSLQGGSFHSSISIKCLLGSRLPLLQNERWRMHDPVAIHRMQCQVDATAAGFSLPIWKWSRNLSVTNDDTNNWWAN
jgi:hypothetical protein